jgi:ribosomal protein S18 acetylase RimI-like enzyme
MPTIRQYKDSTDRVQVVDLWRNVFGYETAHNEPNLAISKKISTNDGLFFVAVENTDIVGTIMAGYDGHRGWLYSVAVDPNKRLSGLGRSLVHHAEKALAELGCMKINLQTACYK